MYNVYKVTGNSSWGSGMMIVGAFSEDGALMFALAAAPEGKRLACDIVDYDDVEVLSGVTSERNGVLAVEEWIE